MFSALFCPDYIRCGGNGGTLGGCQLYQALGRRGWEGRRRRKKEVPGRKGTNKGKRRGREERYVDSREYVRMH